MSKLVLYRFDLSVWAAAAELAVAELGYPDDAVETKTVNLAEGANFDPEFVKINPDATLPTLVAGGKVYTNTKDVVSYLVEHAPKKVAKGSALIDKIHEDRYDPNAPIGLARNDEELKDHASGFPFQFFDNRFQALHKFAAHPEGASFQEFYTAKKAGISQILAIYKGEAPEETKKGFFQHSIAHWQTIVTFILEDLPASLPESGFLGGEVPGEDDFHVGAWLTRVAFLTGGTNDKDGYKAIEKETKQPLPPKVVAYWRAWVVRPGFQKVYKNGLH